MNKKNSVLEISEHIFKALLENGYLKKDLLDKSGRLNVAEYRRIFHEILLGVHESCLPRRRHSSKLKILGKAAGAKQPKAG